MSENQMIFSRNHHAKTPRCQELEQGLIQLGLENIEGVLPLLVRYVEEIELFNPAYGLVKVRDRRELEVRHVLDSLAPINIIRRLLNEKQKKLHMADVGSGAGLPGIPLAVCMSDVEFTLIERMGRRAGFLRNAAAVLALGNVEVLEAEMEKLTANMRFDAIVFRAFKPFEPLLLKGLFALLAPGGIIAAYKGRRLTIDEEMNRLPEALLAGTKWECFPVEVPFLEEERHLVAIITQADG